METQTSGVPYNPANVGITGGSITGVSGVPLALSASGIPFIGLSTGSIAVGGGISGITALPLAYPSAYCYFPANALATAIAAGWYYCTFSTTTAGTAFLNTYTSGTPTIPSSPTAVTDGKGSFTGDITEEMGPQITLPAGSLGVNGWIDFYGILENNNSAGTKALRLRWDGTGGTVMATNTRTTELNSHLRSHIANAGSLSAQRASGSLLTSSNSTSTLTPALTAVNSAPATTLVLSLQRNTATDNAILHSYEFTFAN